MESSDPMTLGADQLIPEIPGVNVGTPEKFPSSGDYRTPQPVKEPRPPAGSKKAFSAGNAFADRRSRASPGNGATINSPRPGRRLTRPSQRGKKQRAWGKSSSSPRGAGVSSLKSPGMSHSKARQSPAVVAALAASTGENQEDDLTRKCTAELESRLNDITSEEIKMATKLMSKMRKKCDWYHDAIQKKLQVLKSLQREVTRLEQSSQNQGSARNAVVQRSEVLQKTLDDLQDQQEKMTHRLRIFGYMRKRLMKQVKAADKRMLNVQQDLNQVQKRHRELETQHSKLAEQKSKMRRARDVLAKKLNVYRERQHTELLKIDRVIRESAMETKMIQEHVVQRENQASTQRANNSAKDSLAVSRVSNSLVSRHFNEQSQQMQQLEDAFQKIRNSTGESDVNEIVKKFLNRNEKYEELCDEADAARLKIEALRKEKLELQNSIGEFQNSSDTVQGNRSLYKEVDRYEEKLTEEKRKLRDTKEKATNVRLLLEETRVTVGRFLHMLSSFDEKETGARGSNNVIPIKSAVEDYVPAVDKLPEALRTVASKVAIMLESLGKLLEQRDKDDGVGADSTFLTTVAARSSETDSSPSSRANSRSSSRKRSMSGSSYNNVGGLHSSSLAVLQNPRTEAMIFRSLMSAAPDISKQNVRVEREKGKESAVAQLLGLDVVFGMSDTASSVGDAPDPDNHDANRAQRRAVKHQAKVLAEKRHKQRAQAEHHRHSLSHGHSRQGSAVAVIQKRHSRRASHRH